MNQIWNYVLIEAAHWIEGITPFPLFFSPFCKDWHRFFRRSTIPNDRDPHKNYWIAKSSNKTFSGQLRVISCSLLLCLLGLQDYGPNSKTPFRQVIHNLDLFANLWNRQRDILHFTIRFYSLAYNGLLLWILKKRTIG